VKDDPLNGMELAAAKDATPARRAAIINFLTE
jgi:hypothetical protein